MGSGDAVIIQRHMEFHGGIAYGIDRLLEPPDLGSRCDEFISVELKVSTWGDADEDPCCLLNPCQQGGVLGARCSSLQSSLQLRSRTHAEWLWGFFLPPQGSMESCGPCGFEPPCPAGSVQRVKLPPLALRQTAEGC